MILAREPITKVSWSQAAIVSGLRRKTAVARSRQITYSSAAMLQAETQRSLRHHAILLFTAGLVFFTNLGGAALFDEDEPKNAVCGREMFLRGDWIVPTFNQELRTDKPILIYWIMLCSYTAFGVNEFAARLGSSVLAVVTSIFVYHLGRKLFHPDVGLWAGVILCTCLMYSAVGRAVTPDSALICCVTGVFLAFVSAVAKRNGGQFGQTSEVLETSEVSHERRWHEFVPQHWHEAVPMAIAMGLAVLAKGPVGVVLPTGVLGVFLLIRQQIDADEAGHNAGPTVWWRRWLRETTDTLQPIRLWRAFWALRLPLMWTIAGVVALPWYLAIGWATDGDWLAGFLGGHNVNRFLQPMENHSGPFFYYLPVIALGTFPWSAFLPLAIWQVARGLKGRADTSPALQLLACWSGIWIAFFSCASTKLPNYVLPAYPPLALMAAWSLHAWQYAPAHEMAVTFRHCCRALAAIGVALLIGIPVALNIFLPSETWLAVIGVIPLAGATIAYRCSLLQGRQQAVRALGFTAVGLAVLIVGIAPARVASHQDGPHFGRVIRDLALDEVRLATFDYFSPNLVFYAADKVHRLKKPQQIAGFFADHPQGLLLTRADRVDELHNALPADVCERSRQRRFLRRHDLVLLGRATQTVQPAGHTIVR